MLVDAWKGEYVEVTFRGGKVVRCSNPSGKSYFVIDNEERLDLKCIEIN